METESSYGLPPQCLAHLSVDYGGGSQRFANVVIDDILAIEPDARAKNGIALSLEIPRNA
jgi:hypothetical protein